MKLRRSLSALALGLALSLSPAIAQAQGQSRESAKRDVAVWADAMAGSFSPGKWQGMMTVTEGNGTPQTEDSTDCLTGEEMTPSFAALQEVFLTLIDNADCTTQSGGAGSLSLTLVCTRSDGATMKFVSTGKASPGAVEWEINATSTGPGAFEPTRMRLSARKLSDQC